MDRSMILLVGEQPAPNLLSVRYLKPDRAALVHTNFTRSKAENLKTLLEPSVVCTLCEVHPYEITEIEGSLIGLLKRSRGSQTIFNLTGGTKPMAIAAFRAAEDTGSRFAYLQTEADRNSVYVYAFDGKRIVLQEVRELEDVISLGDYLKAHIGPYYDGEPRNDLEKWVVAALRRAAGVDEVFASVRPCAHAALEIDFAVRVGNRVGIGEVKSRGAKQAIDMLSAAAEQRFLGTYTKKFLVSGSTLDPNNRELAKAYKVTVIELPNYQGGALTDADESRLVETILHTLGGAR